MLCENCPRKEELNGLSCGTRGPRDARVVIVGTGPGADELASGAPFVGASGRILTRAMLESGLQPRDCFYMNVINCPERGGVKKVIHVYDKTISKGAKIDAEQHAACKSRFHAEFASLSNCRVLVVLGGEAFSATTGIPDPISKYQNHPLRASNYANLPPRAEWVLPLYHPAYIAYRRMKDFGTLLAGFDTVRQLLDGTYKPIDLERPLVGYKQATRWVRTNWPVAFDIENPEGIVDRIGLAVVRDDGVVESTTLAWDPAAQQLTKALLTKPGRVKIAHNAAHDVRYLEPYGITVADPVFDTMWAHQLLNPELEKGLNAVAGMMLKSQAWKHTSKTDPAGYNLADVHFTALLYPKLVEHLRRDGMYDLFVCSVMPALRTLIRMTQRGLRVDPKRLGAWREQLTKEVAAAANQLEGLAGRPLNPNSHKKFQAFLYEELGLPLKRNREGNVTADERALKSLLVFTEGKRKWEKAHEIIDAAMTYRDRKKMLTTYTTMGGAVVHPNYFPATKDGDKYGTATGRLSSSDPNIQNQPMEARMIYVPHKPGNVLLEGDYGQIELRVIAALSGDDRLQRVFAEGGDVHEETRVALGLDRTKRRAAKAVNYGSAYLVGPRQLLATLKKDGLRSNLAECEQLLARFAAAYAGFARWREVVVERAAALGYARNVFSRRRYFYKPHQTAPEVVNFYPQSTVADIILERLPAVERIFAEFNGQLLTSVHDHFMGEVPREHWREAARALKSTMERVYDLVAPRWYCPADIKVGTRWGRMHKVELDNVTSTRDRD